MRRGHSLVRASARTEAVAVRAEGRVEEGLQDLLEGLLHQAILHRGDAKLTLASVRLGDSDQS